MIFLRKLQIHKLIKEFVDVLWLEQVAELVIPASCPIIEDERNTPRIYVARGLNIRDTLL